MLIVKDILPTPASERSRAHTVPDPAQNHLPRRHRFWSHLVNTGTFLSIWLRRRKNIQGKKLSSFPSARQVSFKGRGEAARPPRPVLSHIRVRSTPPAPESRFKPWKITLVNFGSGLWSRSVRPSDHSFRNAISYWN